MDIKQKGLEKVHEKTIYLKKKFYLKDKTLVA